jgi:hypothetical protein
MQKIKYWSCSNFADWLRGIKKPTVETSLGWAKWKRASKEKYPIRYWMAEKGLDYIQTFLWWPIDKIYDCKYYINNRWITRTHSLTAHPRDIKPGQWTDVGNRFLPCLFNELVNFVECELAWWHVAWDKEAQKKYKTPFYSWGWFRWRTWRCREAGLDNLNWQCNLVWNEEDLGENHENIGKSTYQAIKAQEILTLYKWWTEIYPNRPYVHDASGWTAYCALKRKRDGSIFDMEDRTPEEAEMGRVALDKSQEIEQAYKTEDEVMMIRLIKIRDSLWT